MTFLDTPFDSADKLFIEDVVDESYDNSQRHGFWEGPENNNIPTKLALIHSEVSEALECFREGQMETTLSETSNPPGKPEGFPSELADIVIRVADLCGRLAIDLDAEIQRKFEYNRTREKMHGGKRV